MVVVVEHRYQEVVGALSGEIQEVSAIEAMRDRRLEWKSRDWREASRLGV